MSLLGSGPVSGLGLAGGRLGQPPGWGQQGGGSSVKLIYSYKLIVIILVKQMFLVRVVGHLVVYWEVVGSSPRFGKYFSTIFQLKLKLPRAARLVKPALIRIAPTLPNKDVIHIWVCLAC